MFNRFGNHFFRTYGRVRVALAILPLGLCSALVGLLGKNQPGVLASPALSQLMGYLFGLGAALVAVGLAGLLYALLTPKAKLEENEVERRDERNRQLNGAVARVGIAVAGGCMFVCIPLFMALGYVVPSAILCGCVYLVVITNTIAAHYYDKRM